MNIVTIMNYDWKEDKNLSLCATWIKQARLWLTKFDTVYIYSKTRLHNSLIKLIDISDTCSFKMVISEEFYPKTPIHFGILNEKLFSNHNFLFKLYTTSNISFPYLFLDSDAFIIDSLEKLKEVFDQTQDSIFFIDHELNIPRETERFEPFINSGVFLMNDPEHLVYNWEQIYKFSESANFTCRFNHSPNIIIPGSDQSIIKGYFDYIGYDYHHKNFGIEYNTSGSMINDWFVNESGKNQTTLKNDSTKICKIVHYWGKNKPWTDKNCPLIQEIQND
jgi:hypothetical protein